MKYIKTFENLTQAKSIIAKKMEGYEKLKTLLAKNLGYIGKKEPSTTARYLLDIRMY